MMDRAGLTESIGVEHLFPSVRAGVAYYLDELVSTTAADPDAESEGSSTS